jgi:quinol monooxygenase YgiN
MIIRIVKMHFREDEVPRFLEIFEQSKMQIRSFPGCQQLKLLKAELPGILFTYSHWESPEALEIYRQSELFKTTWAKTKRLFRHRAEAWSLETVIEVGQ